MDIMLFDFKRSLWSMDEKELLEHTVNTFYCNTFSLLYHAQ